MIHLQEIPSEANSHRLVGGALCLDFANTINGHRRAAGHEYIQNPVDLLLWCRKAGILSDREAESLLETARRSPAKAGEVYRGAIALRETIYRIFSAVAGGCPPAEADLNRLSQSRSEALSHSRIIPRGDGFVVDWSGKTELDWILWPLALSAADLLTSGKTGLIRECAGENCDWLFLDTSRNHLRRWCTMDECGNRAKSRRYIQRKRS